MKDGRESIHGNLASRLGSQTERMQFRKQVMQTNISFVIAKKGMIFIFSIKKAAAEQRLIDFGRQRLTPDILVLIRLDLIPNETPLPKRTS